jgi:hypothetical protein
MALVFCCRLVLADSVAHVPLAHGLPSPIDSLTVYSMSVGRATAFRPTVTASRRLVQITEARQLVTVDPVLDDPASAGDGFSPGLFDDGEALALGGIAAEGLEPPMAAVDGSEGKKLDWPDLSGIVEALVGQSSRELVAKYRLPGQDGASKARKKKKSKEELMALAKCRRAPRSTFAQGFHILAAALIGTFLVILVLRKSGTGSYWW